MTVSVQDTVFQHVGNGVTTTFAYGCQIPTLTDLEVYLDDVLQTSGYTATGIGSLTGGTVIFSVAPANLAQVRIERVIELERTTDYQQSGDFLSDVVNPDFDRLWMALQGQLSTLKRAIVVPRSDATAPAPLPEIADRANKMMSFDANGNPIAIVPSVDSVVGLAFALASSIGSTLVGFLQAGVGAVLRTVQDKLRENVSVEDFGAVGDGVTISTAAIQAARESLSAGGILSFGKGTFIIDTDACLTLSVAGLTLKGQGATTIIKAKNGANLSNLIGVTGIGCTVRNLVLDGNRSNAGTAELSASYGINCVASNFTAENVEFRECNRMGAFIGSSTATPTNIKFLKCWFRDIGGLNTNSGLGVGIFGGGAFPADDVKIDKCRFENIYNKFAGFPGDSTAMNIIAKNITVTNCTLKNNHNVGGGQMALTSDGTTGAPDGNFIVMNNTVLHDVSVGGESTTAIEIEGRKAIVTGNRCQSLNGDGVRFETSGGDSVISGNVINCTANGVNLITVGGTGVQKTLVHGNNVMAANTGISVQGNPGGVQIVDNRIDSSVSTKIAGLANCELVRGNFGYQPAVTLNTPANSPSPHVFPALNYDAFYTLVTANGIVSHNVYGINISTNLGVPIPVKAGQFFSVYWATTAPIYSICPQQ